MVGGAGGEVAHVGAEEDAGYVGVVGEEFADGDYGGQVAAHDHFPDVDVALHTLHVSTLLRPSPTPSSVRGFASKAEPSIVGKNSQHYSPHKPYSHRSQP